MKTPEQAYRIIANAILDFIKDRPWDRGVCVCRIYSKMASSTYFLDYQGIEDHTMKGWPSSEISDGDAALFLRDDLQRKTGDRVWGLTFTLFPDGKFRVEFDYKKPDNYEDIEQ